MMQLPLPNAWKDIDATAAESSYARLTRLLDMAEDAIASQQRIIEHDGPKFSHTLGLESLIQSRNEHETELKSLLAKRQTEVIDFALEGKFFDEHRAPIGKLGPILEIMQDLFTRVCQSRLEPRPRPKIKTELAYSSQLFATVAYPSSFGLRLTVNTQTDMDGHSLILNALDTTFQLLNNEHPSNYAADVGPYALKKYRNLVNTMIKANATPKITWYTPAGTPANWKTTQEQLATLSNRLAAIHHEEKKIRTLSGTLAGASLLRHRFEFVGQDGVTTGRMPVMLHGKVSTYFNKPCTITFEEVTYIDEATDQPKRHVQLLDIDTI